MEFGEKKTPPNYDFIQSEDFEYFELILANSFHLSCVPCNKVHISTQVCVQNDLKVV